MDLFGCLLADDEQLSSMDGLCCSHCSHYSIAGWMDPMDPMDPMDWSNKNVLQYFAREKERRRNWQYVYRDGEHTGQLEGLNDCLAFVD